MTLRLILKSAEQLPTLRRTGEIIEQINFGYLLQIKLRTNKKIFQVQPKRWVIERTFSWFDNDRRLCRQYELLMETAEEMVKLSAIKLLLNKI